MSRQVVYEPAARTPPRAIELDSESPVAAELRPSGPAAAVVLAAGLAAASASVADVLTLSDRVGDISGLSTAAMLVFFSSWGVLALIWRRADPPLVRVAAAAGMLIALGLLGTFPPFFNAVAG